MHFYSSHCLYQRMPDLQTQMVLVDLSNFAFNEGFFKKCSNNELSGDVE